MPRCAFLDGAVHAEPWRGLVFGVFRNRHPGYNDPDLNFHGLALPVRLPTVETVHGATWTVRADIDDCPDLELVLPARREAVENGFLTEMRTAARLAIYRAMAAEPSPRPAFEDRQRAREAGIQIAPPPALLRPWRPSMANVNDWRDPPKLAEAGHDALVMACDPEPPEAQALWRAAERAGVASRLFEADRRLEGYGWYDALDRVTAVNVRVAADGDWMAIGDYPVPERPGLRAAVLPARPAAIRIELTVRPPSGPPATLDLATDLAFAGEAWSWVEERPAAGHGGQRAPAARARRASRRRPSSRRPRRPTRTAGRPSGSASTSRRCTWRRGSCCPTTRPAGPRSPRPSAANCSGSARRTAPSISACLSGCHIHPPDIG